MRIVSLLASGTEILFSLGLGASLVARSHECDFPASVESLPRITEPKFVLDGRSYEIDARIKAILAEGLSIYRVDVDALRRLRPDIIVTQIQCDVCAVSAADVEAALAEIAGYSPLVVSLNPSSLADVWDDIRRIAEAAAVPSRGEELVRRLRAQLEEVASRTSGLPKPRVASIEWLSPLMAGGNWMPELIELAGGVNLVGEAGKHSPWLEFSRLQTGDPDVILFLPCGFDIVRTASELPLILESGGWPALRAISEGRSYILDGNQYFNRPGPRLLDSLEILVEIFHPQAVPQRFGGIGWIPAAVEQRESAPRNIL